MWTLFRVRGGSMAPRYLDRDIVTVLRRRWDRRPRPGDVVVARHDDLGVVIKRVDRVAQSGVLHLASLSPLGAAPEYLKIPNAERLIGRVLWRWPRRRAHRDTGSRTTHAAL